MPARQDGTETSLLVFPGGPCRAGVLIKGVVPAGQLWLPKNRTAGWPLGIHAFGGLWSEWSQCCSTVFLSQGFALFWVWAKVTEVAALLSPPSHQPLKSRA